LTPFEAKSLVNNKGYVLIDVRMPSDFLKRHPRGAVNVPLFTTSKVNSHVKEAQQLIKEGQNITRRTICNKRRATTNKRRVITNKGWRKYDERRTKQNN
jgi:rhodanese-related sulfurtransferase